METTPIKLRRGRWQDFAAVMSLLGENGLPIPAADRAAKRRFRNIVADLGADLYVAEAGGAAVGVVYVTYSRQIAAGQQARVEQLAVAESHRDLGVGRALVQLAIARARKRECDTICCLPGRPAAPSSDLARQGGLRPGGTEHCMRLAAGD